MIELLAVILIIAVPQIMNTIRETKLKSMESTVRLIATSAEKDFLAQQAINTSYNGKSIPCSDVAKLNDDYASCSIEYSSDGTATVTILGNADGKYGDLACSGTKDGITCSENISSVCNPVEKCIEDGYYFTTTKAIELLSNPGSDEYNSYLAKYMDFVSDNNFLITDETYYLNLFMIMEKLLKKVPLTTSYNELNSYYEDGFEVYVVVRKNNSISDQYIGAMSFMISDIIGKENIYINMNMDKTTFLSPSHNLGAGTNYYFINSEMRNTGFSTQNTENDIYLYNSRVYNINADNYEEFCSMSGGGVGVLPNRIYIDNLSTINGGSIDRLFDLNGTEITNGNSNVTNVVEGQGLIDRYDAYLQSNETGGHTSCELY